MNEIYSRRRLASVVAFLLWAVVSADPALYLVWLVGYFAVPTGPFHAYFEVKAVVLGVGGRVFDFRDPVLYTDHNLVKVVLQRFQDTVHTHFEIYKLLTDVQLPVNIKFQKVRPFLLRVLRQRLKCSFKIFNQKI